jgi:murein DD-endopeptidase MepM/ murein hydrolase activator NlpD
MAFHFSLKRRTPFCALLMTVLLSGMGVAQSFAATTVAPAAGLKLLGVVASGTAPKALLSFPDSDTEVMVAQGDLVSGYTVLGVTQDAVEVQRGAEHYAISLKGGAQAVKPEQVLASLDEKIIGDMKKAEVSKVLVAKAEPVVTPKKPTIDRVKTAEKERQYAAATIGNGRPSFIRPMEGGYVSSGFGYRERILGGSASRYHQGVDIASPSGNPVFAAASGTVTASDYSGDMGRYITIQHSGGYETRYYHLSRRFVEEGAVVKAGQTIGLEGSSGNSTGPHLHFEIRKNGDAMDPSLFVSSLRE